MSAKKIIVSVKKNSSFFITLAAVYYAVGLIASITQGIMIGKDKRPSDHDQYMIAPSLTSLFSYHAQQTISQDSSVEFVTPAQMLLIEAGEDLGQCGADGVYGDSTTKAVKSFQNKNSIHPVNGIIDTATYTALVHKTLKSPTSIDNIHQKLIAPYQHKIQKEFLNDIDEIFDSTEYSLFLRFDLQLQGLYHSEAHDLRIDAASKTFPGCANNHLRDAFRHTETTFRIADISGSSSAVMLSNYREKYSYNGLPLFLMDTYNHEAAGDLLDFFEDSGLSTDNPTDIIVQGIEHGMFMIYPFPLVPKDQKDIFIEHSEPNTSFDVAVTQYIPLKEP